jgi:formylmethanofuran dehydrogenase subunit A
MSQKSSLPQSQICLRGAEPGQATALETIDAAEGVPLHLAHAQFYAYGNEGKNGFPSAAALLAEKINKNKNVTIDVGQVMFADTVTISTDVMKQLNSLPSGRKKKGVILTATPMVLGWCLIPTESQISTMLCSGLRD